MTPLEIGTMSTDRTQSFGTTLPGVAGNGAAGRIRVGVAGWDYPDWQAVVYPAVGAPRVDRLAHISRFVDTVEINSTFYRPVAPRVAESWIRRTSGRAGVDFTAKTHRSLTHDRGDARPSLLDATLEGLQPIRQAGKLGALLVQFPQSFRFGAAAREKLARLGEDLESWPAVVEVRHVSWENDEVPALFDELRLGWCVVDQPRLEGSTAGPLPRVCGSVAYLRLHGRNAANWFRTGAGRDARYDYLYARGEMECLADTARNLAASAEVLYVIQNNHFRGQALANALQMKKLLQGGRPRAPEELVVTYPSLESEVTVERRRLF